MQPTRHALGALLLEQGRVEVAEAFYHADLGFDATLIRAAQHPDNVWSLHGLHECLLRAGKADEAVLIKTRLDLAGSAGGCADQGVLCLPDDALVLAKRNCCAMLYISRPSGTRDACGADI